MSEEEFNNKIAVLEVARGVQVPETLFRFGTTREHDYYVGLMKVSLKEPLACDKDFAYYQIKEAIKKKGFEFSAKQKSFAFNYGFN